LVKEENTTTLCEIDKIKNLGYTFHMLTKPSKNIICIFILLLSFSALAKPKDYIYCLGQEEAFIHKNKIGGAYTKLNKEVISALVQMSTTINMKKKYVQQICNKNFSSLEILRLLMTRPGKVFYTTQSAKRIAQYTIDKNSMVDISDRSVFIFIDFLNAIQSQMKKSDCLLTKIPELKTFFKEMRFILEDVGIKRVMKSLGNPDIIFDKLEALQHDKKQC